MEDLDAATGARRSGQGSVADRFREERAALRPLPERSFEARQVEFGDGEPTGAGAGGRRAVLGAESLEQAKRPPTWGCLTSCWSGARNGSRSPSSRAAPCYVALDSPDAYAEPGRSGIRYQRYLDELAAKPQAVRQVAPELMAELGAPYEQLWRLLSTRYGELEAARVVAKAGRRHRRAWRAPSALADKLEAICELDLDELDGVEPPLGYGRDWCSPRSPHAPLRRPFGVGLGPRNSRAKPKTRKPEDTR